jgi:gamma-glutamyltranspeptidase/glutathione hydrolase
MHRLRRGLAIIFGVLLVACPLLGRAADNGPATARLHMAATANPLATQAALSVLRDGGSAVDAAIAGQMMLAVVEPQSSGLGGGSLVLVWDATTKKLSYFDGLASAPAAMPADWAHGTNGERIDPHVLDRTGRVVGVPGTLRTLASLHDRWGRLAWARLFRDAIAAAENGFAMPRYLHSVLMERPELAADLAFSEYFDAAHAPLPIGTVLRNPALARTLRIVAQDGVAAFYTGPLGKDIVAAVASGAYPGTLRPPDLAAYQPRERDPVCIAAFDRRICSAAPPASGGVALLQQLAILDRLHIGDAPPGSVAAAHLFIEAARVSEADRRSFLGDPDYVLVPTTGLLDPFYLDHRARLISPDHAMQRVSPGNPPVRHAILPPSDPVAMPATTHLAIVDDSGDVVSFTTTINLNFGSDIVADGMVLNDAMTNFAEQPLVDGVRVANAAWPGKRPITTMAPTIVFTQDGLPDLVVGAGGGARIIDSVAEVIVGMLAWHQDVRTAIEQPRIGGQNRAQELERDTPAAGLADALRAMGHTPKVATMNAAVQAIAIGPDGLQGWADPRRDGVAAGD